MKRSSVWFATAFLGLAAATPAGAQQVGLVQYLQSFGYETPPAGFRAPIYVRDPVVAETVLETVPDGRLDVRFLDQTQLIVGPGSKVTIDRFVYDPDRNTGEAALGLSRGLMRFVSGRLANDSYSVSTPTATLGVRGTDFVTELQESGATAVSVLEGVVAMTATGGETVNVEAGFTGVSDGSTVSVAPTVGVPGLSQASFGVEAVGGADSSGPDEAPDLDEHEE